jgi:hypothetical protein
VSVEAARDLLRAAPQANSFQTRRQKAASFSLDQVIAKMTEASTDDPSVLQSAAEERGIIVTHDISALAKHAFDRVAAGQSMPGVFEVRSVAPIGQTIDDLILLAECSHDGEWEGEVHFLPL